MARVNDGSQFYLPPIGFSTYGMSHPAFTAQPQSVTALRLVHFRPSEGRRLGWPGWLGEIPRWFDVEHIAPFEKRISIWEVELHSTHVGDAFPTSTGS